MFILIIYMEVNKPKPINWFPSYASHHKIPYGTYVLSKELKSLFKETEIKTISKPPYQFLKDTLLNGTYFFVNGELNFGKEEFNELLEFVARGNDVFIATNGANIDTLNLETRQLATSVFKEHSYFQLLNKQLDTTVYPFDRKTSNIVFNELDTIHTTALGKLMIKNSDSVVVAEAVNFIKLKHGKGTFFFHTFPEAFTNYNLLKGQNHQYVASI